MNSFFKGHERLMMFYLLSEDIVARTEITDFPRDPYLVLKDPKWREVYESDYFDLVLTDTWAWLVWEHLGIKGGMEKYSGFDPFWRLAHAYPLWIQAFNKMGLTAEVYFNFEPGYALRYLSREELDLNITEMMQFFINNSKFLQWKEVILENRCWEDYCTRKSSQKVDFYRKWYHTRTNIKNTDFIQAEQQPYYPYEKIISRLDTQRFLLTSCEEDQKMIKLLLMGYTQVEIAIKMGYANHSGISERLKRIGRDYKEYMKT